jgi:predicted RNase H-like HicB family nuclease
MMYHVYIEKGEDFGFVAHCPAIPGCHSQGNTVEETIENIRDAIRGCLEALDSALLAPPPEAVLAMDVEVAV